MASDEMKAKNEEETTHMEGELKEKPAPEMNDTNNEDAHENENEDIPSLEDELKAAQDKYLRLYSDFDNFRKRTQKEKAELINFASSEILKEILSLTDDFDRAISANEKSDNIDSVKEGFLLLRNKIDSILKQKEVTEMECADQEFNPDLHEAITNIPAGDDKKGKIIDVVQKGYYLKDRVLRYAKVVVGQ